MSSYLPCGVTDSMCEPYNPPCGNCGHFSDEHYEDNDDITQPCQRDTIGYDSDGIERNSNGEITHACDIKGCYCSGFGDFEYEPEMYED